MMEINGTNGAKVQGTSAKEAPKAPEASEAPKAPEASEAPKAPTIGKEANARRFDAAARAEETALGQPGVKEAKVRETVEREARTAVRGAYMAEIRAEVREQLADRIAVYRERAKAARRRF